MIPCWATVLIQYSCLANPMDRGAWQAMIHSITKSRTQLKRGGARGPRGGTPGLQRESVPWPPTPRRGWGAGAQELGRGGGG